jgi:hypothetical protein
MKKKKGEQFVHILLEKVILIFEIEKKSEFLKCHGQPYKTAH